jgi:CheY-like chemotaxis protein
MNVLVVDDQPEIRIAISRLLRSLGHDAYPAVDGSAAVDLATQGDRAFDVVLLDIQMPGLDGYETARKIRLLLPSGTPIFAVTGAPVDIASAQSAGFRGIIPKPVGSDVLASLFKSLPQSLTN